MTDVEVWGRRQRGLGAEPPAFGDFYNFFNKNNTYLDIIRLKFLLKSIFLISIFYLRYIKLIPIILSVV